MKRSIPLKLKLTAISVGILCTMCAVLTLSTIFSANDLVEATVTTPAMSIDEDMPAIMLEPSTSVREAVGQFRGTTVIVMLCLIALGSVLTYLFAAKTLRPLEDLTERVQHISIHNLDQGVPVPETNDEMARLSQAFSDMTEKLSQSYQVQKHFSANAAHELRTPLAAIQTQLDVFQMNPNRNAAEYSALLKSIGESTDRLSNLVKDLLAFTNEQEIENKAPVALRPLLEEIVFELEESAAARRIAITISGEGTVLGDDGLLQRVFYNLISNAIRYNVDGGSVSIDMTDNQVTVTDTGAGIPDEAKPHIFDAFFCVDKSRSRELGGSGLGLAIVKHIIEKHAGSIYVEDNPPHGSVFVVVFERDGRKQSK